jgi:hypothetical protein
MARFFPGGHRRLPREPSWPRCPLRLYAAARRLSLTITAFFGTDPISGQVSNRVLGVKAEEDMSSLYLLLFIFSHDTSPSVP